MLLSLAVIGLQSPAVMAPQLLWEREIGTISRSLVASPDGSVVGEGGRGIISLDPHTGRTRWEIECRSNYGAPSVGPDGSVYVAIQDFTDQRLRLQKLNGDTGSIVWRAEMSEPDFLAPLVDDRAVYLGQGQISAFSTEDGQSLWTFSRKGRGVLDMALSGSFVVCFLGSTPMTTAIDKGDSHEVWSRNAGGWPLRARGDLIFSNMERFATKDGARLWKADLPCSPLAAGIGPDGDIYCYANSLHDEDRWSARIRSSDGALAWLVRLPLGIDTGHWQTPVVTPAGQVIVENNKDLFELDAASGRQIWSRALPSDMNHVALAKDGILVVYSGVKAFALKL